MAGGVGFSKMGLDSFRHNRSLRNRRPRLKDSPYHARASYTCTARAGKPHSEGTWQSRQAALKKLWEQKILALIFLSLLALLIFWLLL